MGASERELVDEVIAEARSEARAAVKAKLRERFEHELLERAEERLRPPAPAKSPSPSRETGEGLWVYCVAADDHPGVPDGVRGVDEAGRVHAVRAAGLSALVSAVPLAEFGEEGLKRNLNDLAWLERMARTHEAVLDTALAAAAVVPMRVCTIYRGEDHVRELLAARAPAFAEALEWLAGRSEWGVKVLLDRERADAAAGAQVPAAGGDTYLVRKQAERRMRDEIDALVDGALRECHARLEEWAAASELLPAQRRELAGYEGEMVLNGAYLVDDERAEAFAGVVSALGEEYGERGLTFERTGPWPAYHFVGRLQSPEELR